MVFHKNIKKPYSHIREDSRFNIFFITFAMMNSNERVYADEILKGTFPTEAALIAWHGISKKTAQNRVSLMKANVGVCDYIREGLKRIDEAQQNALTTAMIKETAEKGAVKLMSLARKRQILAQIAEGKKVYEKVFIIDGKVKRVKCKPDAHDIMKAIDLDNKMAGDHVKAKEPNVAKAEEVKKVIIMDDQSQNIPTIQE